MVSRFGEFCYCSCLPHLAGFACSHATWVPTFSQALYTTTNLIPLLSSLALLVDVFVPGVLLVDAAGDPWKHCGRLHTLVVHATLRDGEEERPSPNHRYDLRWRLLLDDLAPVRPFFTTLSLECPFAVTDSRKGLA